MEEIKTVPETSIFMRFWYCFFLCTRKFRWNLLVHKKPYRAGSHCGGKVDVARGDPPQAENPALQDSFLYSGKSRWNFQNRSLS